MLVAGVVIGSRVLQVLLFGIFTEQSNSSELLYFRLFKTIGNNLNGEMDNDKARSLPCVD